MKIKKISLLFLLAVIGYIAATAQVVMGSWKIYTPFNGVDNVVVTPDKVYYTSVGYLFSYDPESQETYAYTVQNKLSDTGIASICYNPEGKYLFVAYSNGNIDLVRESGKVDNISDLRDATLTFTRNINGVSFADGKIYLATDFGVVILDDKKCVVLESGIYNTKINSFIVSDGLYFMTTGSEIFTLPVTSRINSMAKFSKVNVAEADKPYVNSVEQMLPLSSGKILTATQWHRVIFKYDAQTNTITREKILWAATRVQNQKVTRTATGYYLNAGTALWTVSADGSDDVMNTLPASLQNKALSFWKNISDIWAGSSEGLCRYSYKDGDATLISGPAAPGSISVSSVDDLNFASDGSLYLTTVVNSRFNSDLTIDRLTPINRIRDGKIEIIDPENITFSPNNNSPLGNHPRKGLRLTPDPWNPDRIYVGNWSEGYMVFDGNSHSYTINGSNSPIKDRFNGGTANAVTHQLTFDGQGNMWALQGWKPNDHLMVTLPAEIAKSGKEPKVEDWQKVLIPRSDCYVDLDGKIMYAKKSGLLMVISSSWENPVLFYDNKGTFDTADDSYVSYETFTDQDGRSFTAHYYISFAEDKNGKVWIGTDDGVIEIPNPRSMFDSNVMRRPKVNRNDGTNTADFLLSGIRVLSIAVDHSNRKWLGTTDNGVYLVNEDGTEILEHFTTDNSPLPSNHVGAVAVSPESNKVFFGTLNGLAEYSSTSSPAAESYSEVVAYPNPVRPGFSGWITIKGLMENSYVKITDAAGNLVFSTISDGGMVIWDGCNTAGVEVPTGVYYIFASQQDGGSSSAVSKIMIVR